MCLAILPYGLHSNVTELITSQPDTKPTITCLIEMCNLVKMKSIILFISIIIISLAELYIYPGKITQPMYSAFLIISLLNNSA